MFLGSLKLEWVTSFKYLGIVFNSACKISIDTSYIRRKFYASWTVSWLIVSQLMNSFVSV